jgi:hypothetical protein
MNQDTSTRSVANAQYKFYLRWCGFTIRTFDKVARITNSSERELGVNMNKKVFLILLSSLFVFSCFSQEKYTTVSKYLKKDIKHSEKYQSKGEYSSFEGDIILINDSLIKYDDKIVKLLDIHNDYKPIFYSGIFYPMYEFENENFDTICIILRNFREIRGIKHDCKVKWFTFNVLLFPNCDNEITYYGYPPVYYFRLKNENAIKSTSIADFIAGAKLTLYWYIIRV